MTEPMTPCGKAGGHRCACCLSMEKRWADLHAEEVVKSIALRAERAPATAKEIAAEMDGDLLRECITLRERSSRADELLELILPLAKGYAAAHPVGSNAAYVEAVEKHLDAHRKGGS